MTIKIAIRNTNEGERQAVEVNEKSFETDATNSSQILQAGEECEATVHLGQYITIEELVDTSQIEEQVAHVDEPKSLPTPTLA